MSEDSQPGASPGEQAGPGTGSGSPVSPDAGPGTPVSPVAPVSPVSPVPDVGPGAPADPDAGFGAPVSPDADQDLTLAREARLSDIVVARLADQARRTTQAARARRLASTGDQPGVADLTPLRELLFDLVQEAQKVRPRERIARALRQAADAIDPPPPGH